MKIYTKTGDKGETSLVGGKRMRKSDIQIEAYGTVDELNSFLGLITEFEVNEPFRAFHYKLQSVLFDIGAHLASDEQYDRNRLPALDGGVSTQLEEHIDQMNEEIPPLRSFILPTGHVEIAHAHIARTVCRRAERRVVALSEEMYVAEDIVIILNRLSDYLFVLSRWMGVKMNVAEIPWIP